jgi:uncharacterized membrane protein (UPF0182 family)
MWYEIIPSFGIIVVAMAAPHAISYIANKLTIDNVSFRLITYNYMFRYIIIGVILCLQFYRRSILDKYEALQYLRDTRLSGDPYKLKVGWCK